MPFGVVGRMGPGMRQVVGFGDRSTGRGNFGAYVGRPIVINEEFAASLCDFLLLLGVVVGIMLLSTDGL